MSHWVELPHPIQVTPAQFDPCYALLQETFDAAELMDAATFLADLRGPSTVMPSEQYVILAYMVPQASTSAIAISLIAGCYLALNDWPIGDLGIGFIEYLVTRPEFRQQGYASALLNAFECEMRRIAARRGEHLRLVLGEVEPELVDFKRKCGYRWPIGSHYAQPPIAFNPHTGAPLTGTVAKLLMMKAWPEPVEAELLLGAVRAIFAARYVPKFGEIRTRQRIQNYIINAIFLPFAQSLQIQNGWVVLEQ